MLETERLVLRNFQMEDKDDCFVFMSDEKHRYMIVEKESSRVVGTVNVMLSEDREDVASIGYVVSPKCRNRGYASEAVKKIIHHYFEYMQINKFLATCFLYNQASARVLEKLGFVCDGVIEMEIEHAELGKLDLLSYHFDKI